MVSSNAKTALRSVARRVGPAARRVADRVDALTSTPDDRSWSPAATVTDVDYLYRLLLGREPDPSGYRLFKTYVNDGVALDTLVGYFLTGPEFRDRLLKTFSYAAGAPEAVDLLAGYRFYVGSSGGDVGGAIKAERAYEPPVAEAITASLRPGATFLDVGASIGFFTVLAGREVGPTGHVIACEPGPQNHSLLLLNVSANELTNVDLRRVAVSDRAEVLSYSSLGDNGSISPFDGDPGALGVHELVQAQTLEQILAANERVDVMKVDVEGAEGRVFLGGESRLRKDRPTIFFELTPSALPALSGLSALELLEWLASLGYELTVLGRYEDGATPGPATPSAIMERFERVGAPHFDVQAVPSA